jgi:hypothetical protein
MSDWLTILNLRSLTRRHLFEAARSMVEEEHYGPALVVAQAAVEVAVETAAATSRGEAATRAAPATDGEEPHPAPLRDTSRTTARPTPTTPRGRSKLVSASEREQAERAREQIEAARRNGVEYVERDGRRFVVLHLPGPEPRALTARVPAKPRAALGPPRVS